MLFSGPFVTAFPLGVRGSKGGGDGEFLASVAVALDGRGNIYVSDQTANTIQKITLR
ncbi:MAG: hypothetical protein WA996_21615 [Candidatus Promineifilaceae bacterium]